MLPRGPLKFDHMIHEIRAMLWQCEKCGLRGEHSIEQFELGETKSGLPLVKYMLRKGKDGHPTTGTVTAIGYRTNGAYRMMRVK